MAAEDSVGRAASGCIFCGNRPLTKEHIFPRWLAKILTAEVVGSHVSSIRTQRSVAGGSSVQEWPAADVASFVARVVCGECNSGWMSEMEAQAQSVLETMVRGEKTTLMPVNQLDLAAWTTLKSYIVEYALGDEIVAADVDRRSLMSAGHPSAGVPVRIGAIQRSGIPNSITRCVYNVGREGRREGLAACTTFALGCVVLQACHGLGVTIDWTTTGSRPRGDHLPVNPPCPGDVQWPPTTVLDASSLHKWERPIPATDPGGISDLDR